MNARIRLLWSFWLIVNSKNHGKSSCGGNIMCERMNWVRLLVEKGFRISEVGARDFIVVV